MTSTECIEWKGTKFSNGYGRVRSNGKDVGAHRVAWRNNYFCEIPKGMVIMHTCDNKTCINPEHLKLGAYKDNTQDMLEKGRANKPIGSRSGNSKLNEADIPIIRERLASGDSQAAIAKDYAVVQQQISRIKHNTHWSHAL